MAKNIILNEYPPKLLNIIEDIEPIDNKEEEDIDKDIKDLLTDELYKQFYGILRNSLFLFVLDLN